MNVSLFFQVLLFVCIFSCESLAEVICSSTANKKALVIIDMQPFFVRQFGFTLTPKNVEKVENVIAAQIEAIRQAKNSNSPIVFIEYYHPSVNVGDTSEKLKNEVLGYPNVKFIKKTKDSMFDNENENKGALVEFLKSNNIKTLIISGANGGACVRKSIQGALDGNCNVIAYNAGIADFNYQDFIHPYINLYSDIQANCSDCAFTEAPDITKVRQAIKTGIQSGSPATIRSHGKSAVGAQ